MRIWRAMLSRCTNPKHQAYRHYGALGITVCVEWRKFPAFYAAVGPRPSREYTLDRIDGVKGYEPGNCRWATPDEQLLNKKNAVFVEFEGKRQRLVLLCRRFSIPHPNVRSRLLSGWPLEKALTTPVHKPKRLLQPRTSG